MIEPTKGRVKVRFKVKKLRKSILAKLSARILCILSVMECVILGLCFGLGVSENLFNLTEPEALKKIYENINIDYSVNALKNFNINNSRYKDYLRENYFQYGIIISDNLKEINIQDNKSYQETNMTDDELASMNPEQLYLCQIKKDSDGYIYHMSGGYYNDYEELDDNYNKQWVHLYADRICYDVVKGIIYYRAEGYYYPVQSVSLCYGDSGEQTIYNYSYNFSKKKYQLNDKTPMDETPWVEESVSSSEKQETTFLDSEVQSQNDSIEEILDGSTNSERFVNLADLNNTTFNNNNWGMILLDNIRNIRGDELTLIDSSSLSENLFINEPKYYLNEDFTLVVEEKISGENYWVISIVPNAVPSENMNSKYNQEGWIVKLYYDIMDKDFAKRLLLSVCVMILSFSFLVYSSGHRRGVDGIVLTLIDKIPIDLLSFGLLVVEAVIFYEGLNIVGKIGLQKYMLVCAGLLGAIGTIMVAFTLEYVLSLCTRLKAGKWWRNSILYRIFIRVVSLFRNVVLFWKLVLFIGIISFMEFFVLINWGKGSIMVLWIIEKLILGVVLCKLVVQLSALQKASQNMAEGNLSYKIDIDKMFWECRKHGENLNKISEGMSRAVDERTKSERLKTELITNVSHDIKTPLTSIINYVDLLSKEELHNDKAAEYLEVLDRQSSKLKKLIEDLVEASKASSGNMSVEKQLLEAGVFVTQTAGEFEEKLKALELELIVSKPDEVIYIMADGRHIWRVIDNLMNNICKYAQPKSRVYVTLESADTKVSITFRNISKFALNISGEELMERFVRGDKSRNTEGHGLGLSIAQSLMKLNEGEMKIVVDGDLFKVILIFNRSVNEVPQFLQEKEQCEYTLT